MSEEKAMGDSKDYLRLLSGLWQQRTLIQLTKGYSLLVDSCLSAVKKHAPEGASDEDMKVAFVNVMNTAAIAAVHSAASSACSANAASSHGNGVDASSPAEQARGLECVVEVVNLLRKYYPCIPEIVGESESAESEASSG